MLIKKTEPILKIMQYHSIINLKTYIWFLTRVVSHRPSLCSSQEVATI
jgi:hypothetical protein